MTLAANASCDVDVVMQPTSSPAYICRLVFAEGGVERAYAEVRGQPSP